MGTALRVLLVEDSEDDALLLLRELGRGGYEPVHERVFTAEAMEAALDAPPEDGGWEVVISDHSMPTFDSSAALALLREKGFADVPFLIVSGKIGEEAAVAAMRAGAQDYIMKDNLARLNSAIERELGEAESRRERRRAEAARRAAEAKYRSIFENAVEGIFQTTADGGFVTANPAMARMFGYGSPEELLEDISDVGAQLYASPEGRAEFDRLARRDGVVAGFEVQMRRKDGGLVWASVNARAVRDAAGKVIGYEGTIEDITARKRAEEELREIREAERRRIARELHDVVLQDLTYALQSLQVSRRFPESVPEEEDERQVEALRRAVAGIRDAIYELRLEEAAEQPVARSLEALVDLNRQMAPEVSYELRVEEGFPEALAGVAGVEMVRVAQEALANVRRHSGADRVWVRLGATNGTPDGTPDGEAWVEVEDDGRGIGPGEGPGTGITGMGERAQAIGGELRIGRAPGGGTLVSLRVPLCAFSGIPEKVSGGVPEG